MTSCVLNQSLSPWGGGRGGERGGGRGGGREGEGEGKGEGGRCMLKPFQPVCMARMHGA